MKLPTWQPRDRQMSERRHYDPPTLWYAVVLGSIVIHLSAFGILRLLTLGGLIGMNPSKKLIPIDVVAMATPAAGIAPSTTTTTQLPPKTNSTPAKKPIQKGNQTPRKIASTSSPKGIKSQPGATKQPISTNTKKSPTANSSKSSVRVQPETKPTPTGKNSQSTTTTPNSSPSPGKTSPTPQSSGGLIALPGKLLRSSTIDLSRPGDNEPATLLDSSKQLTPEELKQLGISAQRDLKLNVGIIVETNGTATVGTDSKVPQVVIVQGSISQDKAVALANAIIQQLRFKPTQTSRGPIAGNYTLLLSIRPAPK